MNDDLPAARWWYGALLLGIAVLLFGLHLGQVFPPDAHAVDPGYGAPVLAFEFAGGQHDLIAIFGPDSDPRQVGRLAAMRTGNEQDYIYMLLYTGFLASGLIALSHELGLRALKAAATLPILAGLCDAWENWLLFDIQAAFTVGDYSPAMASLPYPVAAKFALLALTNVAIGLGIARIGRWHELAGTLVIVACVPVLMAIAVPARYGWTLLASTGGGWIVLLGLAMMASWRAAVRKRPLVEPEMPAPATRRAEPDAAPARKLFGRRGA
ncbi:hypothetical protein [Sphingopyxis sp.]|uniref:hypothetical protein n=1 Tax=Sphingopyxis sp. TaxID=1908224 RepID=UPI0035ADBA91